MVATGLVVVSDRSLAQSSDIVLQRLERVENENAALRDRIRRLEGVRSSVPVKPAGKPSVADAMAYKAAPNAAKAPALYPAPNWSGLYFGASAGWGSFRSSHVGSIVSNPGGDPFIGVGGQTTMPLTGSGRGNGALADFRAGYNVRISSQILAGLQLEGTLSQVSAGQSAHIGPCSLACTAVFDRSDVGPITIDWMASVLGRLGGIYGDNNYLYGIGDGLSPGSDRRFSPRSGPAITPISVWSKKPSRLMAQRSELDGNGSWMVTGRQTWSIDTLDFQARMLAPVPFFRMCPWVQPSPQASISSQTICTLSELVSTTDRT
jgi:hypothetical protein